MRSLKDGSGRMHHLMQFELEGNRVWLTTSDFEDADTLIHGVFTTEEAARNCALAVEKRYPRRNVDFGEWGMNEAYVTIGDGHLS
jgi:hypothetical protein